MPYARQEESAGIGGLFWQRKPVLAILSWGLVVAARWFLTKDVLLFSVIVIFISLGAVAFSMYSRKRIGGGTGDTLGALCELTELLVLLAAVIRLPVTG